MPPPPILKVIEVFSSIQGEGLRQGEPTVFVRLSGCNLRCPFCDTKYAWTGGLPMTPDDIVREVRKARRRFPARWVCLTGGEPFLQDIGPLTRLLKKEGFRLQVETNGTLFHRLSVDWYTVSPKPRDYTVKPEFRRLAKEIKVVVSRELEMKHLLKLRKKFPASTPLLLQPQSGLDRSVRKALFLLRKTHEAGCQNIRLSFQIHKALRLP